MMDIEDFLRDINACVVPSEELECGEYCFHLCVNPFQHPCLDQNIHHLTALLTALSNTCGGVVHLNTPLQIAMKESPGCFSAFKSRLLSLPGIRKNLLETLESRDGTFWAIIAVKKCQGSLSGNFDCVKLWLDIHGQLQREKFNTKDGQLTSNDTVQDEEPDPGSLGIDDVGRASSSEVYKSRTETTDDHKAQLVESPVEFSTIHELNWDTNKVNWQGTLEKATLSPKEVIDSCDIWEASLPMQMTPDRDSLKHLFPSETECFEALRKLETQTPGFGIASKSWGSLLPRLGNLQRPPNHLCDILTVAKPDCFDQPQPMTCLWVIVSSSTDQIIQRQIEYMFIVGRAIKHQLSKQDEEIPNLAIQCLLHSSCAEDNATIQNTIQKLGIQHMQQFLCSAFNDMHSFDAIRRCIALLLLSQESPMKTSAGNQLSVKLSAQQAKALLNIKSRKVSYISSAPGTGKTLCGLALYRDFGKTRSVYISPTEPLLQYLKYNGCEATLVRNDKELYHQIKCGTFDNKMCVIIDESHRLRCSKAYLRDLFMLMKEHKTRLFVFADNAYQSFDRENQQQIQTYIYELSREVWERPPYEPILSEIYRNTRKVVSFLQHAMGDPDSDSDDVLDIACGNPHEGDGIQCIAMENLLDNSGDNNLVQYLHPLLDSRYQATDVALLLDSGYTDDAIRAIHLILQRYLPRVTTQSATTFPREGIVVDRVERFAGLDATLCIFLLCVGTGTNQDATIANPRYRLYLASRATHKAVFIVPRIAADVVEHMKFDYIQVSFL